MSCGQCQGVVDFLQICKGGARSALQPLSEVTRIFFLGFLKWTADEDRLLVCQMIIKLADIGGPTKTRDIHVTWTKAICQEFFMQVCPSLKAPF